MEYLFLCQEWLKNSEIYQEFLIHLPEPLNNVYFDLLVFIVLIIWFLQWIFEGILRIRQRRSIKKRRKDLQKAQEDAEMQALQREKEMRQRQERMDKQMKFLQMYLMLQYMPKQSYQQTQVQKRIEEILRNRLTTVDIQKIQTETTMSAFDKDSLYYLPEFEQCDENIKNEFERLMELIGNDEIMQKELQNRKLEQEKIAEHNQRELDKKLKWTVDCHNTSKETIIYLERQKELERRKAKAVKLALKEQKRAEKKKWRFWK